MPPLSGVVPRIVEPSRTVIVTVGVPEPLGVTVAESVTDCPKAEGFNEDVIVILVGETEIFSLRCQLFWWLISRRQTFCINCSPSWGRTLFVRQVGEKLS